MTEETTPAVEQPLPDRQTADTDFGLKIRIGKHAADDRFQILAADGTDLTKHLPTRSVRIEVDAHNVGLTKCTLEVYVDQVDVEPEHLEIETVQALTDEEGR